LILKITNFKRQVPKKSNSKNQIPKKKRHKKIKKMAKWKTQAKYMISNSVLQYMQSE